MCYEIVDFNPFEPIWFWDGGDSEYIDSEPMEPWDWTEWLEGGNEHQD